MEGSARKIRIRRGYDLPISGGAGTRVERGAAVRRVAVLGSDYPGIRPSLNVAEGDPVSLGDTLFVDRKREAIRFTAPAAADGAHPAAAGSTEADGLAVRCWRW